MLPRQAVKNFATSWTDVNEALSKSTFDNHYRMGNPYKEEVAAIVSQAGAPHEMIRSILRLVQSKMKWNESYRLFSDGPRAAAGKGTGSSADINFVLMAALRDAGFKVVPVLLSPRHYGRLPYTHPTIDGINAFVVRATLPDGSFAFVDGTDPNADVDLLPTELLVDRARIYGIDGESGWCDLTALAPNASTVVMALELDPDGTLSGSITEQYTNQPALSVSTDYTRAESKEAYIEALEKEHDIHIESLELDGTGTRKVVQKYRMTSQPADTGEFVYINATVIPFMSTNQLNAQSRTLPIEFPHPITYNIRCSLELPEGCTVEELPKNINISAFEEGLNCRFVAQTVGRFVQFNFQYTIKRIIYLPEEFEVVNSFMGMVADLSNSRIVIRKSAPQP